MALPLAPIDGPLAMGVSPSVARFDVVLFDLEGTLIDPGPGATKAGQHALARVGVRETSLYRLRRITGPPLVRAFELYYNLDPKTAQEAADHYSRHYLEYGIVENSVYRGVPEMLRELQTARVGMIALSSRQITYLNKSLRKFNLYRFFTLTRGSSIDGSIAEKDELIESVLEELPVIRNRRLAVVGDREQDITGARANGLPALAVSYGFGSAEELKNASPDQVFEKTSDLCSYLLEDS